MNGKNKPKDSALIRDGILPRLGERPQIEISIRSEGPGIRFAFRIAASLIAILSFLVIVGISYFRITEGDLARADASMRSEVNYLCLQLASLSARADAFNHAVDSMGDTAKDTAKVNPQDYELLTNPIGNVLEGYTLAETGSVVLADNNTIVASDDQRLPVGGNLQELLGANAHGAVGESLASGEMQQISLANALADSGDTEGYLLAGQQGNHTIVIVEPSSMVHRERSTIMAREAAATYVVLLVVLLVVDRLLIVTVARRIDATNETLQQVVEGNLDARIQPVGTREFRSLAKGINVTVDALEGWIDEAEQRMEQDLAIARRIQEGALPKAFPAFPDVREIELFASMDPAREVGGDFYDFFELDSQTVAFLIADVSGKGIPASLFMMAAKNEIENCLRAGLAPAEAIATANKSLCANNEAGMFVTVWAATLNHKTGLLTFVNAGHNFPLLRHNGKWEWVKEKCGLFLGTFDTAKYRQKTLTLEPGDGLLLYTDGVNEAFSPSEEEYGNDRLEAFVAQNAGLAPKGLVRALRTDVATWANGAEQSDDVTIMAVEVHGLTE